VPAKLPKPSFEINRHTLDNGLRVVVSPDRSAPVVAIAVLYDVGFRSEPEGRTGFAHLFEHLMFQGSVSLEKLEHFRYVESSGGTFNGSTHFDYTNYFEALPANALERGLFLEADRMRGPRITEENLANQLDVVKNEIRVNVLNAPYGGFPWIYLPAVLFDTFANSHNGYGDFADLESATTDDAREFFQGYYAPGNAVLAVAGDLDVDTTIGLIEKHFGQIKKRRTPKRPSFAEPPLTAERRDTHRDPHAPLPAVAIGYRVPDPVRDLDRLLPAVLLAEVLGEGDASRLQRRLVQRDGLVTDISAYVGQFGDAFDERDPTALTISARHPATTQLDAIVRPIDEELARIAEDGLERGELDRVRARLVSVLLRDLDPVISRTLEFAKFELLHGRAELIAELPPRLAAVTDADVRAAATDLRPDNRAVLELVAGGAQ
jgi:predicted Zn-dependent peptidase